MRKIIKGYPLFIDGIFLDGIINECINTWIMKKIETENIIRNVKWKESYIEHEKHFAKGECISSTIEGRVAFAVPELRPWNIYKKHIQEKYGERGVNFLLLNKRAMIRSVYHLPDLDKVDWDWLKYLKLRKMRKPKPFCVLMSKKKLKLPKLIFAIADKRVPTFTGVLSQTDYEII